MSSDDLVSVLQRLAEVLQTQRTLGATLAGIAEAATVSVPGCDAASIAISIAGRPATAAVTARVALDLDMVQYDTQDGPCLTAFHSMSTIRVDLVDQGDAFPHFARAARRKGLRGVLSVPATWGDEVVATLNLYSGGGPFDESAESVASVLAAQVAIAVSRSPEFAAARGVVEQAQRDADDAAEVNVAAGLLMVNESCTAEQAEGLLRQAANRDERTILEIAQRIIHQHHTSR
ncbi:MAG TPA: GAF domain-containing protein [Acidimicrobiales bacterium]|nr:GAF domain-containing protein [Acidimicrobiales bacterium]